MNRLVRGDADWLRGGPAARPRESGRLGPTSGPHRIHAVFGVTARAPHRGDHRGTIEVAADDADSSFGGNHAELDSHRAPEKILRAAASVRRSGANEKEVRRAAAFQRDRDHPIASVHRARGASAEIARGSSAIAHEFSTAAWHACRMQSARGFNSFLQSSVGYRTRTVRVSMRRPAGHEAYQVAARRGSRPGIGLAVPGDQVSA